MRRRRDCASLPWTGLSLAVCFKSVGLTTSGPPPCLSHSVKYEESNPRHSLVFKMLCCLEVFCAGKKWTERELTLYKSPHVEILSQKIIIEKIPFTPRTSVTSKVFALLDFWVYELSPSSPEWTDPSVSYKRCLTITYFTALTVVGWSSLFYFFACW